MHPSFNVLKEKWVPVAKKTGKLMELGLRDTVLHAHSLDELAEESPLMQFGLYRLLIAFVTDAYQINSLTRLEEIMEIGSFSETGIENYTDQCGDVFDLFHPQKPFLQSEQDPTLDRAEVTSVSYLFQQLPSGTNVIHFSHQPETVHQVAPEICARALCTISPFMTSGGAGYSPSINGIPPWYVLVRGKNLFETLLLNCCVINNNLNGNEPTAWRSLVPVTKKEVARVSLLEGLTWRPRRVRLVPGDSGICTYSGKSSEVLVQEIYFSAGFAARTQSVWTDPQVAYRISDKGRKAVLPSASRQLWRDIGPLLLLREAEFKSERGKYLYERPLVVSQFHRLRENRIIEKGRNVEAEVFGLETDGKMKMIDWRYERLSMPAELNDIKGAASLVQQAIEDAESVEYCLRLAMKKSYPRNATGNNKAFDRIIEAIQNDYWNSLRNEFDGFIGEIISEMKKNPEVPGQLLTAWRQKLRRYGGDALECYLDHLDADGSALERQVSSRQAFYQRFRRVFAKKGG